MSRSPRAEPTLDAEAAAILERPVFFDTNVLLYSYAPGDVDRRQRAQAIVAEAMRASHLVVSAQVLQEFYDVVLRRRFLTPADALAFVRLLAEHMVVPADAPSVLRAMAVQQRYRISIWDALIVQSALDAGCETLLSEDLQHGQRFVAIGGTGAVTVINPFALGTPEAGPSVHEPRRGHASVRRPSTPKPPRHR